MKKYLRELLDAAQDTAIGTQAAAAQLRAIAQELAAKRSHTKGINKLTQKLEAFTTSTEYHALSQVNRQLIRELLDALE